MARDLSARTTSPSVNSSPPRILDEGIEAHDAATLPDMLRREVDATPLGSDAP